MSNRAMSESSLPHRRTLCAAALLLAAAVGAACEGCEMARMEWYGARYAWWPWITYGWLCMQGVICLLLVKRLSWRLFSKAGLVLSTMGFALAWVLFFPFWASSVCILNALPLSVCLASALPGGRLWPAKLRYATWGTAALALSLMWASSALYKPQDTLAERLLKHNFNVATMDAMGRLRHDEPASFHVYREMLQKGSLLSSEVAVTSHALQIARSEQKDKVAFIVDGGKERLMEVAAGRLLFAGNTKAEMPLVLETVQRLEQESGFCPFRRMFSDFFEVRYGEQPEWKSLPANTFSDDKAVSVGLYQKLWETFKDRTPNTDLEYAPLPGGTRFWR